MKNDQNTAAGNVWKDAVMGVITGDALGCPVQFRSRASIAQHPVTGMTGYGTYNMPEGTFTDDGSLTLAALDSILQRKCIDPADIMDRFVRWLVNGDYTPFGEAFDNGRTTTESILRYRRSGDPGTCGGRRSYDNGNGSLMRIMPACLYSSLMYAEGGMTEEEAVRAVETVSGLTHGHLRARIACGLYFFMVREMIVNSGSWLERDDLAGILQKGLDNGFAFYKKELESAAELSFFGRLQNLYAFRGTPEEEIRSGGYVVETLEAALWSLLNTKNFRDALLTAVNLGEDTDSVGAVCGGLAGLFYGYKEIPEAWLAVIKRREWIEALCDEAAFVIR